MRLPPTTVFRLLWDDLGGPPLEEEFRFHPKRRFRADFRYGDVLIEVEGGTWVGGRHNRPQGYAVDCAKYNLAQQMGYQVYRFTSDMLTPEHLLPVIEACRERA